MFSSFYAPDFQQPCLTGGWETELMFIITKQLIPSTCIMGFPGGAVVKNPPSNAGDTGLSPGPRRSHMPRSS